MMIKKLLTVILLVMLLAEAAKITYEEYSKQLSTAKQTEEEALPRIAELKSKIATLKIEIEQTQKSSQQAWEATLGLLGTTQEDYDDFINRVEELRVETESFRQKYADDLKAWSVSIIDSENKLQTMKNNKVAALQRVEEYFEAVTLAIQTSKGAHSEAAQASENTPAEKVTAVAKPQASATVVSQKSSGSTAETYTVEISNQYRDCLWKIAGKPEVFGNPYRWKELYDANAEVIKNPNLIYPGQTLKIPR
ncbi:MAG: LysM peptidoglycan-binding domain-containing protein [Fibrobacteria bacterium]|nr:LysM peptidoglycan-binding domain-containing protein [Fibrobacteria bacterium]